MKYTLKKSLGQHFLHDDAYCRRIVESLDVNDGENVLEIGPGGGALTRYLSTITSIDFKAVELDNEKVHYLHHHYPALQGRIIEADILITPMPFDEPFVVVGNFPYNISTEIVFRLLDWRPNILRVVGMFQKEVAMRLAAPPGSKVYGITSVLTQAYFKLEYLFDVPPEAFTPPPKVWSGVIRMTPREVAADMKSEEKFKLLVKTAFNQRRKQLRNAVKHLFHADVLTNEIFNRRAEQLSVEEFGKLSYQMN